MKSTVTAAVLAVLLFVGYQQVNNNETQRALFIGNSYTTTNDLPSRVADVLDDNGIDLEHETIAPDGRTLAQHATDPAVRDAISSGDFDLVILQDQSETPAIPLLLHNDSIPAAETLGALATGAGARVIVFETWGHRNGSTFTGHTSFEAMQAALTSGYWTLAEEANATVAPVGSTWAQSLTANEIALHQSDDSHPTAAGTHLASLVIARTILGQRLTETPSDGIPDAVAEQLAALLW